VTVARHANLPQTRQAKTKRIVVIDDSVVARAMLNRVFESEPDFAVCAMFDRANRALEWLADHHCDLILLDIEMPGRSGLSALPELIAASGDARIVVVSSIAEEGATATLSALALGATDAVAKPAAGQIGRQFGRELVERLRNMTTDVVIEVDRPAPIRLRDANSEPVACVAIGASTGGIHALAQFLQALPTGFNAPILITQHLPPSFMKLFAAQIEAISGRPSKVAQNGDMMVPGTILIAPGDGHLCADVTGRFQRITIQDHAANSRCLPSVDPMFESVGAAFGSAAIGVVLSGMGRDGSEGAASLVARGGTLLAQDHGSATIWGMPGAVARAGLASLVASPRRIAAYLGARGSAS
jgi:two-component system, chemotaxis family, protein-glutamate methylesterase/glutaminase